MVNSEVNLNELAEKLRVDCLDIVTASNAGFLADSFSAVELLTVLYFFELRLSPRRAKDKRRDRFVLSMGHAMEAYYAVLARKGFLDFETVKSSYAQFGTEYIGQPNNKLPGIEMMTGPTGHGMPLCVGMALSGKMDNSTYRAYTLLSDEELIEGSVWEAVVTGAQYKLDNLCAVVNRSYDTGGYASKLSGLEEKFAAFGWHTVTVDGHNCEEIKKAFREAKRTKGMPTVIIANTVKGKGSPLMEANVWLQHNVPDSEQYAIIKAQILAGGREDTVE